MRRDGGAPLFILGLVLVPLLAGILTHSTALVVGLFAGELIGMALLTWGALRFARRTRDR